MTIKEDYEPGSVAAAVFEVARAISKLADSIGRSGPPVQPGGYDDSAARAAGDALVAPDYVEEAS